MTHRGSLDRVAYGLGVLPIIRNMKAEHPGVTQPWYADDAGSIGLFGNIEYYFNSLIRAEPESGYYPKPTKIVLIVHTENINTGNLFGTRHGFNFFMGTCYLGGFIGYDASKRGCLIVQMVAWDRNISTISETAVKIHSRDMHT